MPAALDPPDLILKIGISYRCLRHKAKEIKALYKMWYDLLLTLFGISQTLTFRYRLFSFSETLHISGISYGNHSTFFYYPSALAQRGESR
jgi:hypothetical protein